MPFRVAFFFFFTNLIIPSRTILRKCSNKIFSTFKNLTSKTSFLSNILPPIYDRECIVSGPNFWNGDIDNFTRTESANLIFRGSPVQCVSLYQYICRINYSRNSKFNILHLYHPHGRKFCSCLRHTVEIS